MQYMLDTYFPEAQTEAPSATLILVGIGAELRYTKSPSKLISKEEIRDACSKMGLHAAIEVSTQSGQGINRLLNHIGALLNVRIPGVLPMENPEPPQPPKRLFSFLFGKKTSETHSMKELFGRSSRNQEFPSYGHTSVVYSNCLFVFGGTGPERELRLSPCRVLDISRPVPQWIPLERSDTITSSIHDPTATTPSSSPAFAFSSSCTPGTKFLGVGSFPATCTNGDGTAFIFGGLHAGFHTNRLVAFNMIEHTWATLFPHTEEEGSVPATTYGASLVHDTDHLFLFGGCSPAGACSQFFAYSLRTNTWTSLQVSASPPPRYHHNAFVRNRVLYVYGGLGPRNCKLSDLWALDLNTLSAIAEARLTSASWTHIPTTGSVQPTPQRGHVGCFWPVEKAFFLVGSSNQNPLCEVFKLDLVTFTWARILSNSLPVAREFHSVVANGMSLIISCGMWRKERPEILGDGHILSVFTPSICLPSDVWSIIFSCLGWIDLCRLSHTSRYFYNLCSDDTFWARFLPESMRTGVNLKQQYLSCFALCINPSPGVLKYTPPLWDKPAPPFCYPYGTKLECFLGDAIILRADLTTCRVDEIKVGDSVMSELYCARVIKEIHTKKIEKPFIMVYLNGVGLTTGHPVFINNKWQRSSDVAAPTPVPLPSFTIFNFVLDGGPKVKDHSVILNGLVVCTLGKDCGEQIRKEYPLSDQLYGAGFWDRTKNGS
ncbi:hypothetical protein Pelo_13225 [Pelomyxa schiedti]|nr:hypothetical protein Pelo_13225 [Pelomyxa schiedti]